MRVPPQTIAILRSPSQLNHFEAPTQVDVEALPFRFAIQRGSAVDDRIGRVDERVVFVVAEAEALTRQISAEDSHPRAKVFAKLKKPEMKLKRSPQPLARFFLALRANQKIQLVAVLGKQSRGDVAAQISARAGYEDRHSGSDGGGEVGTTAARAFSGDQSSSRGARDSRGRPSIRG